jgi:hypothetical protein
VTRNDNNASNGITSRIYGKVIKAQIEDGYVGIKEQNGFWADQSYIDSISCLQLFTEKCLARSLETCLVFIDGKKAYDSVPLAKIWLAMIKQNVNITYVKAVNNLYGKWKLALVTQRRLKHPRDGDSCSRRRYY